MQMYVCHSPTGPVVTFTFAQGTNRNACNKMHLRGTCWISAGRRQCFVLLLPQQQADTPPFKCRSDARCTTSSLLSSTPQCCVTVHVSGNCSTTEQKKNMLQMHRKKAKERVPTILISKALRNTSRHKAFAATPMSGHRPLVKQCQHPSS